MTGHDHEDLTSHRSGAQRLFKPSRGNQLDVFPVGVHVWANQENIGILGDSLASVGVLTAIHEAATARRAVIRFYKLNKNLYIHPQAHAMDCRDYLVRIGKQLEQSQLMTLTNGSSFCDQQLAHVQRQLLREVSTNLVY